MFLNLVKTIFGVLQFPPLYKFKHKNKNVDFDVENILWIGLEKADTLKRKRSFVEDSDSDSDENDFFHSITVDKDNKKSELSNYFSDSCKFSGNSKVMLTKIAKRIYDEHIKSITQAFKQAYNIDISISENTEKTIM